MNCAECGDRLGGRWGNRCYTCNPGGPAKKGEDRICEACGTGFYVPGYQLRNQNFKGGRFCSRECKYDGFRKNPVETPRWARRLLPEYGITYAEFKVMLETQGGKCAICNGGPNGPGARLHVDHDHETNKVRGLLCGKCNTAIGLLDENADRLARVVEYLSPPSP